MPLELGYAARKVLDGLYLSLRSFLLTSLLAVLLSTSASAQRVNPEAGQAACPAGAASTTAPAILASNTIGPSSAPVTIMVFSDLECFPCARSAAVLFRLLSDSSDVRLIFKHAPAASNPNSLLAHEALLAAGAQGKFWEMHDLLFANQTKLAQENLIEYAGQLNLNVSEFRRSLDDRRYRAL